MPTTDPAEALRLRPGRREHAPDLARLVDLAGEGLASFLWAEMAEPGETALDVGVRRAERDEGAFSWRNAVLAEVEGSVAGMLVAYRIADAPVPLDDVPAMFRPMQALENRVLGTLYVNVLATYPRFRRRGVARRLLTEAELMAGPTDLSLIVGDRNLGARRLYEGFGFAEVAREPVVKAGWETANAEWVLMSRERDLPPRAGVLDEI
jgi:ribosomal protein S18 acetylase RimI-like enzyme